MARIEIPGINLPVPKEEPSARTPVLPEETKGDQNGKGPGNPPAHLRPVIGLDPILEAAVESQPFQKPTKREEPPAPPAAIAAQPAQNQPDPLPPNRPPASERMTLAALIAAGVMAALGAVVGVATRQKGGSSGYAQPAQPTASESGSGNFTDPYGFQL